MRNKTERIFKRWTRATPLAVGFFASTSRSSVVVSEKEEASKKKSSGDKIDPTSSKLIKPAAAVAMMGFATYVYNGTKEDEPAKAIRLLPTIAGGELDDICKLEQYTEEELKEIMRTTTCQGNNPLHLVAQNNSAESITELTRILGSQTNILAVQSNREGIAPAMLLNNNIKLQENMEKFHTIASMLFSATTSPPISELSDLIDEKKLFTERYPNISDERLRYNLSMAVQAINQARTIIKKSSTHHAVNLPYSESKREEINEVETAIKSMRKAYFYARFFSFQEGPDLRSQYAMKRQVANCRELADIVYMYLKRKGIESSCEIFILKNGDHVFNVIGRLPGSNPNEPTTWGKNAIVADAWSGNVYSANELKFNLNDFRYIRYNDKTQYYLGPFNPCFHKLEVIHGYHPSTEETSVPAPSI